MSKHSWSKREKVENGSDRSIFVTEVPEGFYVDVVDNRRSAATRLSPEAAQSLADWLYRRLLAQRDLRRMCDESAPVEEQQR